MRKLDQLKNIVKNVTGEDSEATTIAEALKELADYYEPEPEPEQVATPTATPAAGEVESGATVELETETEGATIYYTTDGTTPTAESTEYEEAIEITEAVTIKAIAVKDGMTDSEVLSAAYTIASEDED